MMQQELRIGLVLSMLFSCGGVGAADDAKTNSFYNRPALFSTRPSETKSLQTIDRFGPVGMGIELHQPAFVMKVKNIEEGSPAAATGKLRAGQIIETINGQKLEDIDPRIQLGQILAAAEARDGVIKFMVKESASAKAEQVIVKIPVLGAYSATWPLNCPKSNKIVRNFADYLAGPDSDRGFHGIGMLFLLSTGQQKDLEVVRGWARGLADKPAPGYASWFLGYGGMPLCEYYLRTGDRSVLPTIQRWVDAAEEHYYLGGWSCRGYGNFRYMGGGHLNAGGTPCATFVLLAKECGVKVEDRVLLGCLRHFYRFAGRGNNPYGDHRPESGFVDNGKTGALAFMMAAAASLTPDGDNSLYAKARDVSAVKSFYTTSYMLHGHTGGGVGEIWRSAAMGLLYEKNPKEYREFMDNRQWHYDLSRRWDGSFCILGGARYDNTSWGAAYGLAYTIPRKTLRLTGAPPSKFSKKYRLPERPWGTRADDEFLSLEPAVDKDGNSPAINEETLANDSAMQIIGRLNAEDVSIETLRRYAHHQDHGIRRHAAQRAAGLAQNHIGWTVARFDKPAGGGPLIVELLKSRDARVRRAGVTAIRISPERLLTDEVFALLVGMVSDPEQSWWVVDGALETIGLASADQVAPHVDVILSWLKHDDWWLQNSAIRALTPVATDERCYRKIFPVLGEVIAGNQHYNTLQHLPGIIRQLQDAGPEVQKLAVETLGGAYAAYPELEKGSSDVLVKQGLDANLEILARTLSEAPGGFDELYEVAGERFPQQILPYSQFYLNADPARLGPKVRDALRPIIMNELIPAHVGRNRARLLKLAAAEVQSAFPGGAGDPIDQLTNLYRRAGIDDYGWHLFGPNLRHAEWWYHTFDPIPAEQVPWDQLITRYRDVTLPKGMEDWYSPEFDPQKAGWKRGQSAFGNWDGKIPEYNGPCSNPNCYGKTEVKTLWDKEVLLLHGTFTVPPMKEGYRYRLRVNDGDHVGSGGGYAIYINGKLLIEQHHCAGRGQGAKPKGAFVTKEFLEDFQGGKVTIAVKTFLRFNSKYKVKPTTRIPQGRISLHFEEQRLPPMGDDLMHKSATVIPMLSSEWQANQDPDNRELQSDSDKYLYDGKFARNPTVLGTWTTIDQVETIEEFTPEKKMNPGRPPFTVMTFKHNGRTDQPLYIWSGDTLMDLGRYQALKMKVKKIDGEVHLFIEAGGFSTRNPVGWQSPWYVLKREK